MEAEERDALPAPFGPILAAMEAMSRLHDTMLLRLKDLAAEQKRMYEEQAELRDELHTLAAAVVAAGLPLVES